ncbi:MAG: hypothetical protein ACRD12_08565 [Acidimicrobiales bacterium]
MAKGARGWDPAQFPFVVLGILFAAVVGGVILRGMANGANAQGRALFAVLVLGAALSVDSRSGQSRWSPGQRRVVRVALTAIVLVIWIAIFTAPEA